MMEQLRLQGFRNIALWSRGVDVDLFHPSKRGVDGGLFKDLPRPVFVYVGRVSVEKNIEAFLKLDLPGSKVVVGDGPARRGADREISRRAFRRLEVRRGAGAPLRRCRRVCVPQFHRHVRAGDPGSGRDRNAGGRLMSRLGRRTFCPAPAPAWSIRICARRAWKRCSLSARTRARWRSAIPGALAPRISAATLSRCRRRANAASGTNLRDLRARARNARRWRAKARSTKAARYS